MSAAPAEAHTCFIGALHAFGAALSAHETATSNTEPGDPIRLSDAKRLQGARPDPPDRYTVQG
jgi:hypothetical protein